MKTINKFTFLTILIFIFNYTNFAQNQSNNIPDSFIEHLSIENVDHIQIPPPSLELIKLEDIEDEKNGQMMKIARLLPVNLDLTNSGTWSNLSNEKSIWRLHLSSQGAKSCVLHFDRFILPEGSKVYVYNTDHSVILGPFTSKDNPKKEEFAIGLIYGEDVIIEYSAPKTKSKNGKVDIVLPDIKIAAYSYVYRGEHLFDNRNKATGFGTSQSCQVNVNCSEGANWRDEQKGIARIYCVEGYDAGYCSGTLINNTSNDQTPYFLTADHCGTNSNTSDFNEWIFKFNYESSGCEATTEPSGNSVYGCTRKSRAELDGGSDFLLVELNTSSTNLKNIGAVYNGWSKSTSASPSGVSIHHPNGDIKKISTYTNSLTSTTYEGTSVTGATNAHWEVYWAETTHGHGVTEFGSSGSPIFNNYGLVVGTLSGGRSECEHTYWEDLYGKFSYHWQSNGSASSQQLKYWLDPDITGATTCTFLDPNNLGIVANFSGTPTTVTTGNSVSFTDLSSGGTVTSHSWSFPGGIPSSSTAENPTVTYNTPGTYDVTLSVNSNTGNDTEIKTDYINVISGGNFSYDFEDCYDFEVDDFNPCTTYDGDGYNTFGIDIVDYNNESYIGSYIAFNATTTVPASSETWEAHNGLLYGACFAATTPPNNDWFITPQINLQNNSAFIFWAKSVTEQYGLERFNVYLSTTTNSISSFTQISSGSFIEAPINWTKYEYDLSAYDGQSIYIAIQCVSHDAWAFQIDDLLIETEAGVNNQISDMIHVYPNPSTGIFTISLPGTNVEISIKNILGQEIYSVVTNSKDTKIDLSNQNAGLYFVEVEIGNRIYTKKISIE